MSAAHERLCHLLELAEQGPAQRAALAGELADLLLDGPCPEAMRAPAVALLEKTARETDEATRAGLAARLGGHGELPLDLLNEFYLSAPARVRREILMRNELAGATELKKSPPNARAVVAAARAPGDFSGQLTAVFAIARPIARTILADPSGEALAVLCKGSGLDRATFSALALLKGAPGAEPAALLAAYDLVPQNAAERLTAYWRAHHAPAKHVQAAE